MPNYRIVFTLSLLMSSLFAQNVYAADSAQQYASCTEKVRTDPKAALAFSESWFKEDGNRSAAHCKALALYALKRFDEAAEILDTISEPLKRTNLALWQDITQQAARSWRYAGQMHRSIATLNRAIVFASERAFNDIEHGDTTVKLLATRAEYHALQNNPLRAVQDYDHALSIRPNAHQVRLTRATLLEKIGETRLAEDDARYIINATPANDANHQSAKTLLK